MALGKGEVGDRPRPHLKISCLISKFFKALIERSQYIYIYIGLIKN
jgi:hypothetical protein